ncbi:fatty acid desaturase [Uliginosibacterium sp. H3]|uniref:Fatty acid desaturase n=1 Tax=Uliginosibacterium silvisoli TaxID=3114758 RepID=A0ABU6K549_9RHOO|nr:fatty acid desaturase [Uliginosibacterium sp. H3]
MFSGLVDLTWWEYVLCVLVLTHITIASVTIFLHRHQAHRALDLHALPSLFFRAWLWLTTGMVTKQWAAIHRKHHAKCETAEDPHSPQILGIKRVLFAGVLLYVKETRNKETMERYGHGTPDDWMERNVFSRYQKLGVAITMVVNMVVFGVVPGALIWLVQMAWIPFWAAGVINGAGHYWGYRNYECADASRNLIPWGIWIGGEELHNNHHTYATSAKLSSKWYEFDIGWMYIRILEMLGLAKVKKTIPVPRIGEARNVIDLDMLQNVITHRYDVMTRYVKSLQKVYAEELAHLRTTKGVDMRKMRGALLADAHTLSVNARTQLAEALAHSPKLEKLHAMREELSTLWARSSASSEQLLKHLQDWCHRAEESGVQQLRELSLRMRSYAA